MIARALVRTRDLLRRGIEARSVGAESYLALRSECARSLSTLTVGGYVLGIGDRHLENFMLEVGTGVVIGIDFGHAFASATWTLPQPELMAVRLTTQLPSILEPLQSCALLKEYMGFVLRALLSSRPLRVHARTRLQEDGWGPDATDAFRSSRVRVRVRVTCDPDVAGALRSSRLELLRVLEVFIMEPLLDWQSQVSKQ